MNRTKHMQQEFVTCAICGRKRRMSECRLLDTVRPSVAELVLAKHPKLKATNFLCRSDLAIFRQQHIENILRQEKGELSKLDYEVIKSLVNHETLARNMNQQFSRKRSLALRIADAITTFSGSMPFVYFHIGWFFLWVLVNSGYFSGLYQFDPFPYGLLTMIVSLEAIFLATFILISQNVQSQRSDMRAELDYKVNLKAELQIRQLNEKIDYLTQQQWHRLLEMQELEIDLLEDKKPKKK